MKRRIDKTRTRRLRLLTLTRRSQRRLKLRSTLRPRLDLIEELAWLECGDE